MEAQICFLADEQVLKK